MVLGTAMIQLPNICKTECKSMFDTYQESTYSLRPSTACCTVLVPIHSTNLRRKIVSCQHRNSSPVPCLQNGHHGHQTLRLEKLQTPWREPGDMCFSNTKNFPYPRRNVLAQTSLCCLLLPKKGKSHMIHLASS